jgi:hypothetical protein
MLESNMIRKQSSGRVRLSVVAIAIMVLFVGTAAAQDSPVATPQSALGTAVIPLGDSVADGPFLRRQAQKAGSGNGATL